MVGGGFAGGVVSASYPSAPNSWTVTEGLQPDVTTPLTAYAVCLNVAYSLDMKLVSKNAAGSVNGVTIPCPAGSAMTGGGFKMTPDSGAVMQSIPQTNGWRLLTSFDSDQGTIFALCAQQHVAEALAQKASITSTTGSHGHGAIECDPGQVLTSGGFEAAGLKGPVTQSAPTPDGLEWEITGIVSGSANDSGEFPVNDWAVCVTLS
jgi:hypothetical protein